MSRKFFRGSLGALALVYLALGTVRAQGPSSYSSAPAASPPITSGRGGEARPVGLSRWIVGTDPDCCGPLSDHTPMKPELFIRSGVSIPIGDGVLQDSLQTGWAIQGGYRALCFNDLGDTAWTFEVSLMNIYNQADNPSPAFNLLNVDVGTPQTGTVLAPSVTVTLNSLNRTWVSFGAGREWYLFGSATGTRTDDGAQLRIGIDGGGRWGTAKAEFNEFKHRDDVIGGIYGALHSDLDIPCGCCTFFVGFRGEYDYTWSDVLQIQNKSEFGGANIMVNFGVRY